MSRKKIIQIIAICFLIIAVILLIPNTKWNETTSVWGFISLVFGTMGSIVSIFIPTVYTFTFTETEWEKSEIGDGYFLKIDSKKHGMGNSPQAQTYLMTDKIFEEVVVDSLHDEYGTVTIRANPTFNGKVIIT